MIASLILATLNATFLLAVLAIAIDMHFDHHFITDLVFELIIIKNKQPTSCCNLNIILHPDENEISKSFILNIKVDIGTYESNSW